MTTTTADFVFMGLGEQVIIKVNVFFRVHISSCGSGSRLSV